jgi:large subunit ribosomal protein L32
MAEPKKRLTSTRSGNRRSHLALKKLKLATCPKCNEPIVSHRVCPTCGTYKGEQILNVELKNKKK